MGEREREFTPFQPHRADAGAARTSPGRYQNRLFNGMERNRERITPREREREREVLHLSSHTRLLQVLPGHPPADPKRRNSSLHGNIAGRSPTRTRRRQLSKPKGRGQPPRAGTTPRPTRTPWPWRPESGPSCPRPSTCRRRSGPGPSRRRTRRPPPRPSLALRWSRTSTTTPRPSCRAPASTCLCVPQSSPEGLAWTPGASDLQLCKQILSLRLTL